MSEKDHIIVSALRKLAGERNFLAPEVTVEGQAADFIVMLLKAISKHRSEILALPHDNPETLQKQGYADARLWEVLRD